jgi:thymidylate kinase
MLIILEGNECCFKTTIANKLSSTLNIPVVKGSSFELAKCTNNELFQHFKSLVKEDDLIIDRFIYSNQVYASLYDDFAILTDDQRREIELLIKEKATVYYLHADDNVIKERLRVRGDEYVNEDMIEKISNLYPSSIIEATIKTVSYDTEHWSSDEIVREIRSDFNNK